MCFHFTHDIHHTHRNFFSNHVLIFFWHNSKHQTMDEEEAMLGIPPEDEAEMAMLVDSVYPAGDESPALPSTSSRVVPHQQAQTSSPLRLPLVSESEDIREELAAKRMNELTQKYLTGRLPFSEYLKTLESHEGEVNNEEDDASFDDDDQVKFFFVIITKIRTIQF